MKVSEDVMAVLRDCTTDGEVLRLPKVAIDRGLYERVARALAAAGAPWMPICRGFLFMHKDAGAELDAILRTGEVG